MKAVQYILLMLLFVPHESIAAASTANMTATPSPSQTQTILTDINLSRQKETTSLANNNEKSIIVKDIGSGMPWWGQTIITLFGFLISAIMIVLQMKHQHKNSLLLQQESSREALRLQIYQTIEKQMNKVREAATKAGGYLMFLPTDIKNNAFSLSQGVKPSPLRTRAVDYNSKNQKLSNAIVNLLFVFESYEIACPDFEIFKIALSSAMYDLREVSSKLFMQLLELLPSDLDDETAKKTGLKIIEKPLPNDEKYQNLVTLIDQYKEITFDITCYMDDLRVDAQNKLLNNLFENKIPPRKSLNPKYKVVTTEPENIEELKKYFENETAWGKHMKTVRERRAKDAS